MANFETVEVNTDLLIRRWGIFCLWCCDGGSLLGQEERA